MIALRHTGYMTATHLRQLWRQPWWIAVTLVQPVIWLLLFGALFQSVADLPGFGSDSYIEFLAPGIVIMTAFFTAGWTGWACSRTSIVASRTGCSPHDRPPGAPRWAGGAAVDHHGHPVADHGRHRANRRRELPNGPLGVAGLIGIAVLISAPFATLSLAFALVTRKEETLIATLTFLQLPLSFISSTLIARELMPDWMEKAAANFNPVEWAVVGGRAAALGEGGFGVVASRAGLLAAFLAVATWLALRALESYQRSL